MTSLLTNLATEVSVLDSAGKYSLLGLLEGSLAFLDGLRDAEKALIADPLCDPFPTLENATNSWHKASINALKAYNTLVNRFLKNVLTNHRYTVELDDAYPFPINLHNSPVRVEAPQTPLLAVQQHNQTELLKAIILHLLKIGQCDIVKDIVKEVDADIDELLLRKFKVLNEVVDDITVRHDLSRVLTWFREHQNSEMAANYAEIEFKFCVLQFVLLLNGDREQPAFTLDSTVAAYLYSKENFPRFFKDYVHEISPIMTLLLFQNDDDDYTAKGARSLLADFSERMQKTFVAYRDRVTSRKSESQFVGEVLASFKDIHSNHLLFVNLSNEFIAEYCRDLRLLSDLSLFQSVLLGFVNLPSFHKYSNLQRKLSRVSRVSVTALDPVGADNGSLSTRLEAPFNHDLPFQLPDSNRFLFKYHPIFICPVSKEQLIPLTPDMDPNEHRSKRTKKLTSSEVDLPGFVPNPVVVLLHCRHVALQDSIWQLLKRGTENFKCHYCYKKHKISEVTDAYFIDL